MTIRDKDLASGDLAGTMDNTQLFAGDAKIITEEETVASGQGVVAKYTVVGRLTASGKLAKHTPGASNGSEVAVGILTQAVNATAADVRVAMYTGGFFNHEALTWHASLTTLAARKVVFERTPIKIGAVRL